MTLKSITHIIYSTFIVENHKEFTALMFIMCLRHQDTILRSLWIICYSIWSDLINHLIVFISHFCNHFGTDYSWTWSLLKFLKDAAKKQKQWKSVENSQKNTSFKIHKINAAAYHTLIKQLKKNIQLFSLSVCELNEKLKFFN